MMDRIKMDVHPPLYYIILRGWTDIFTNSLFSLRAFSIFFSFLAIFAVYFFINQAFKNRALALLSSVFYALSYFQIQYAMEARMYSLGTFLIVISSLFFLKALETKKIKWWLLYALNVSLGIYTHYFAAFWIVCQAIYLVCQIYRESSFKIKEWLKNKNFLSAAGAYLLVLISYIPWLPTFLKQFNQVQETYWIPAMNIWSIPNTFSKMTFGAVIDSTHYWLFLVILTAIVIFTSVIFLKKTGRKEKWFIFIALIFPFLATAALSYKRSIYIDRYFIFGFPFYLTILTGALLAFKAKLKKIIIPFLLIGVSLTFPFHWKGLQTEKKPGMAAAAGYLNENVRPGEKIFVGSSLIYFTFRYYNTSGVEAKLYAPDALPHFSGTALLSESDIIANFSEETKKGDIVWMLNTTGFGNYQPQLPENWLEQKEKGFQEVNDYQGWLIVKKYEIN